MIKHSNKILYVGAGCHIQPVSHFKNIKEFVFIDTQPRNEFDSYTYHFSEFGYRTKFVVNLIEECRKYNFILNWINIIIKKLYHGNNIFIFYYIVHHYILIQIC